MKCQGRRVSRPPGHPRAPAVEEQGCDTVWKGAHEDRQASTGGNLTIHGSVKSFVCQEVRPMPRACLHLLHLQAWLPGFRLHQRRHQPTMTPDPIRASHLQPSFLPPQGPPASSPKTAPFTLPPPRIVSGSGDALPQGICILKEPAELPGGLVVRILGFVSFTAMWPGSIPGQGPEILPASHMARPK